MRPRVLEMKLKSFLTPSARTGSIISLERIRERFRILEEEENRMPIEKHAV